MHAPDFVGAARGLLRHCLAWTEDPEASIELRLYARNLVGLTLNRMPDERTLTDVLVVLHRAVDRGDMLPIGLVYELPRMLDDGQDACAATFLRLGNHALGVGATDPLIEIANAAVLTRWMDVPAAWICAVLEAESGAEPREKVIDLVENWLSREGSDAKELAEVLKRRPELYFKLYCAKEVPF